MPRKLLSPLKRHIPPGVLRQWERHSPFFKRKGKRFQQAEIGVRAAALAFHSLLGIVPMVGMGLWYLSYIQVMDRWMRLTREFVVARLNVGSSEIFLEHFDKLTGAVSGNSWGYIGLGVLAYTSYNLIARFGESLDLVLETSVHPRPEKRRKLWLITRRFIVMLGLPVALTVSLAVSQWVREDSWFNLAVNVSMVGPLLAYPVAWASTIVALFFIYYFVPRTPVQWTEALWVAAVVGPVLEGVRALMGHYNAYAVSVHKIYGILAVIPMLILWVQATWSIVLAGGLLIRFPRQGPEK